MRKIRRQPIVADTVTAQLREAILNGTLAPGSRVRQEALAARLGVSRAPIRQALLVLERDGLVQRDGRRGALVAPLDPEFISDIYEFRAAVDAYVASSLATRDEFDPAPFRRIIAEGRAAVRSGDLPRLIDLDSRFHIGLYEAAGNRVMVQVMRAQWTHIRRAMAVTLTISGYPRQVWDEHAAILEAIARHRVTRAGQLARTHTTNARTVLLRHVAAAVPADRGMPRHRAVGATVKSRRPRASRSRSQSRPGSWR